MSDEKTPFKLVFTPFTSKKSKDLKVNPKTKNFNKKVVKKQIEKKPVIKSATYLDGNVHFITGKLSDMQLNEDIKKLIATNQITSFVDSGGHLKITLNKNIFIRVETTKTSIKYKKEKMCINL
jgi:hypothetical protein